jgi:phage baseplate assembly protein gpV
MSMCEIGRVVASYPQGQSVDVLLDNGSRLANVQLLTVDGSDASGTAHVPDVGGPADDSRWSHTASFSRTVRAVVAFIRGCPVCMGFLLPQVTQMTFNEKNRKITRHPSDVYTSIDDSGNFELFHPSGTYLRIGSSSDHEDLTGKDFDGLWKVARNTGSAPHVHLGVSNAGASVASLDFDPSGNVTLQNNGNLQATVGGTTTVDSAGAATVKAPSVLVDSPATVFTGAVTVQGAFTFEAGATGQAGSGEDAAIKLTGAVQVDGTITSTGDQVAGNISQIGHKHGGVQTGGGESDVPVEG